MFLSVLTEFLCPCEQGLGEDDWQMQGHSLGRLGLSNLLMLLCSAITGPMLYVGTELVIS